VEGRAGSTARLIVIDVSTIVGAALRPSGIPRQAFDRARETAGVALSQSVLDEVREVLARPKFVDVITQADRDDIIRALTAAAAWFKPLTPVNDCRDPDDNKYLELALAARAVAVLSSDNDLLVLDPWRDVRIVRPSEFLRLPLE
jgi:putative PIN family toxin of toxin-antitoxin system